MPCEGELIGGFVADGESVVARRDAAGLFQQADPILGLVPALVHLVVEAGRAPARRAPAESVSDLAPLPRNGVRDLPPAQVLADLAGGVRPIGEDRNRPGPRRPPPVRGMRMRFIISVNSGASPRCPEVMAVASTWKEESTARWIQ